MLEKTISVIIPAYNAEKYIAQCIYMLKAQSYKKLEIIVVDDGSTDQTYNIARQLSVKFIRQSNQGVSAARNIGLKEATGEYVHFLDADDLLNVDFYKNMIRAAHSLDAEVACCGLNHERHPSLSRYFTEDILVSIMDDKVWLTNVENQGNTFKYLIKRTLIDEHNLRFDEDLRIGEDAVYSLKLIYYAKNVVGVAGATYFYKNRINSAITRKRTFHKASLGIEKKKFIERRERFIKENKLSYERISNYKDVWYKLFGVIPFLRKRKYDTGRERWSLFGLFFMQSKK